ncbi:hypothetical protein RHGRI_005072 [Rhododendron griersonianum]|uniref:FAR1 domain-containing protein n=1 Tax=Rhododendron griersonianum TaxID=479676 RepID=A0AAV6LDC2_9ERIC|nr:hypothetical protein RHGRI_005072 [Rhododendron griersonianum]
MINRKFVCSKEGVKRVDKRIQTTSLGRLETRTNCKAFLYISLDRASLKWTGKRFDETHNHLLHITEIVHMMRNQRGLTESQDITVEIAKATGLPLKLSHDLISAQSRGKENVGFMREDIKSNLHTKRERDLQYGEAGALLRYFQKQLLIILTSLGRREAYLLHQTVQLLGMKNEQRSTQSFLISKIYPIFLNFFQLLIISNFKSVLTLGKRKDLLSL